MLFASTLTLAFALNANATDRFFEKDDQYFNKKALTQYSKLSTQNKVEEERASITFNKVVLNHPDEIDCSESDKLFEKAVKLCNEEQYQKAISIFEKSAQYNVNSQYNLGILHEGGFGCEKSVQKAMEYYTIAASNGHPEAEKKYKELINKKDKESKSFFRLFTLN